VNELLSHKKLTMTPCTGQTYSNDATTHKTMFHQTPNRHYHWPEQRHAVWRMARLESRRRARQAAIPPRVSACSLRTEDTRMRLLIKLFGVCCSVKEREPPERKHLSRGRKRNQHGIPLVAASEMGTVQTESRKETCGRCRVKGLASSSLVKLKWPEKTRQRG
jgi:hypothetical protein